MKRFLTGFGLGLAGIALALGLTLGALAVAGPHVGEPPTPPSLGTVLEPAPTPTESPADGKDDDGKDDSKHDDAKGDDRSSATPTDSPTSTPSTDDDHSGSGSDDDEPDDD